jgi:Na+-transporting methylmalonyl-CoA/oxaloacetate decarboxylase gamma subunit
LTYALFSLILLELIGGIKMVNWGKAFELFFIGLGGVFVTLIILQFGISLYSKIINGIENMMKKKG